MEMTKTHLPSVAVIGGTGALGNALATRWARAGYSVNLGSREAEKAHRAAEKLKLNSGLSNVVGLENAAAALTSDVVVLAVPYASHADILTDIKDAVDGKIVVDTTVPLVPPKVGTVQLPPEGSAAQSAQNYLGKTVAVVSALQNVAAAKLQGDKSIDCDVLVCGDKKSARDEVIKLIEALGLRGLHAGPLANSAAAEALTSILITVNRRYGVDGAGIRITGIVDETTL